MERGSRTFTVTVLVTSLMLALAPLVLAYGDAESPWSGSASASCGAHNQITTGALPWASSSTQPLDNPNAIGGVIRGPDGAAVAGALVLILGVGSAITDAHGEFLIIPPADLSGTTQFTAIVTKRGYLFAATIDLTRGVEASIVATTARGGTTTPASCRSNSLVSSLQAITDVASKLQQHIMSEVDTLSGSTRVSMLSVSNRSVEQLNTALLAAAALPTEALTCPRRAQCRSESLGFRKRALRAALGDLRREAFLVNRVLVERERRTDTTSAQTKRRVRRLHSEALKDLSRLPKRTSVCSN